VPLLIGLLAAARADDPKPLEFRVRFDPKVTAAPFTGRVYVMLSRRAFGEPRFGPDWFQPEPFFARDVQDLKPLDTIAIDGRALGFPSSLTQLPPATYAIQAVMDLNRDERDFSNATGNGYSLVVRRPLDAAASGPVELLIDQVVSPRGFPETDRVKLVEIPSKLLSEFHGRPVRLRAGVVLPASYATQPEARFATIYEIPGFGGDHQMAHMYGRARPAIEGEIDMIRVVLDANCPLGHHVFADSENNGPCGRALVAELIPHIERTYRSIPKPSARLLTGHSSGGWSSLWLQVTYPETFGGTWSTAPDPVDFRDFQRIDIYRAGENMFRDAAGQSRPIARVRGRPVQFVQPFSDMEAVMGPGGQLHSFEAVFSPRGPGGRPRLLWNRTTGEIDRDVARAWERYDIRLVLERNWSTLGPKLTGKLHVFMGAEDTFYLDGATRLLKESLAKLGSDAVVEILPGRDHGTLLDPALRARIAREMAETVRRAE
jgi:hypothetical protein